MFSRAAVTDSLEQSCDPRDRMKPSPRMGIAYALNDKTVIRAGYGIFYGVPYAGATRDFTSGAFTTSTPWVATVDGVHPNTL